MVDYGNFGSLVFPIIGVVLNTRLQILYEKANYMYKDFTKADSSHGNAHKHAFTTHSSYLSLVYLRTTQGSSHLSRQISII